MTAKKNSDRGSAIFHHVDPCLLGAPRHHAKRAPFDFNCKGKGLGALCTATKPSTSPFILATLSASGGCQHPPPRIRHAFHGLKPATSVTPTSAMPPWNSTKSPDGDGTPLVPTTRTNLGGYYTLKNLPALPSAPLKRTSLLAAYMVVTPSSTGSMKPLSAADAKNCDASGPNNGSL
ncbi:MAG: hypothetical protein H6636_01135 [Anaerolineales bacterium]|nr:hypothetical protein [Anaerolineales bacterium]